MRTTIDSAGRLVIPGEIRREAGLQPGTAVEVRWRDVVALVTQEVVLGRAPEQRRLAQLLTDAYQLVPDGLVFRLVSGRSYVEPAGTASGASRPSDGCRQR